MHISGSTIESESAPPPAPHSEGESVDISQPERAEQAVQPHVTVVRWEHILRNSVRTAEEVADAEVIVMEVEGVRGDGQRRRLEQAATICMSSTATPQEREQAMAYIRRGNKDQVMAAFLGELQGTDKRFVSVDANRNSPEHRSFIAGARAKKRYSRAVAAHKPSEVLTPLLLNAADKVGESLAARDSLMARQIVDVISTYAGTDTRIAVLLGAAHTGVIHQVERTVGHRVERADVSSHHYSQHPRERTHFDLGNTLERQRRFRPSSEAPDRLVKQVLLRDAYLRASRNGDLDRSSLLEKMTDTELSELLFALDALKARRGLLDRLPHRRKRLTHALGGVVIRKIDEVEARVAARR
jgi:hypothetical protein